MVFLGIILTTLFGFLLTILISRSLGLLQRIALGFGLGLGLQSLLMFYLVLLRIPLTAGNVALMTLVVSLALVILVKKRLAGLLGEVVFLPKEIKKYLLTLSFLEIFLLGFLLLVVFYILIVGIYWPISDWDAIALYDWRAKVFASTGFMDEAIERGYFFGYPLMTSMAHTWIYLLGGVSARFIYPLIYLSLIIIFYSSLREFTSRPSALLLTVLMATWPSIFSHAAMTYTNLPYTFYFVVGILLFYIWIMKQKEGYLAFGSLMVGLSTWVRSQEPFWMAVLAVLIVFAFLRRKFLAPLIFLVFFLPIHQSWRIFLAKMVPTGFNLIQQTSYSFDLMWKNFDQTKIISVIEFIFEFAISSWTPILILLFLVFIVDVKKVKKHGYFLFLLVLNLLILFISTFLFSYTYPGWDQIWDSFSRMSMFFIPLLFFGVGLLFDFDYLFERLEKTFKKYFI